MKEKTQKNHWIYFFAILWQEYSNPSVLLMLYPWGPERLQRFCREAGKTWIYWPSWTCCAYHRCTLLPIKVHFLCDIKLQHLLLFLPQGHVGQAGKPGPKVASQHHCLYRFSEYQFLSELALFSFLFCREPRESRESRGLKELRYDISSSLLLITSVLCFLLKPTLSLLKGGNGSKGLKGKVSWDSYRQWVTSLTLRQIIKEV